MFICPPIETKGNKPRRKVIRKHIANIIERMLADAQNQTLQTNELREVAQEKAQEIDETCFVRYGDDDKAYTECVKNGLCQTTADIISKKSSISDEQFKEMNDHLEDLKSIVQNYKSDDVKRIYGMNVSNIKWLIDFIEIIKQRDNLDGVEQNVSIAYCSSFLPIMQKIKENQPKEPSPSYSPPDDLFDFEDNGWF